MGSNNVFDASHAEIGSRVACQLVYSQIVYSQLVNSQILYCSNCLLHIFVYSYKLVNAIFFNFGQGLSAGEHSIGYIPLGGPGGLPPGQGLKNITPDKLVRLG